MMQEFKSIGKFTITGRGEIIVVKSQSDENLTGKIVLIDDEKYDVRGVEQQGYLVKGKMIGLIVIKIE